MHPREMNVSAAGKGFIPSRSTSRTFPSSGTTRHSLRRKGADPRGLPGKKERGGSHVPGGLTNAREAAQGSLFASMPFMIAVTVSFTGVETESSRP